MFSEEFWRLGETCCHSNFSGKPSPNVVAKNFKMSIIIIIITEIQTNHSI